ncbi:MAG: alginate export family protein [Candidatus Hydrogenedentes bacterium]|nr:alginate export family protein [Candidatus Hydrogenedentota bacterium]
MRERRGIPAFAVLGLCVLAAGTVAAELQNIQVGGSIEIWGNYYTPFYEEGDTIRIPADFLPRRPIGADGAVSGIRADGSGNSAAWVEQRTTLNVSADFTNEVSVFIELDSIDDWGEDFRSNYITGADSRANSSDDLEVYQAYIEVRELLDMPLQLRIGRQELIFGSEWLVGNNFWHDPLSYLSFDAVRLTYAPDDFSVDVWWSKLAERGSLEEDGDVDFYGVYASYTGIENLVVDAYWLWLRDGASLNDTNYIAPTEWLEDVFGLDDYDVTNIHTVGLRAAGEVGAFDYEAEVAYQWGDASQQGFLFKPFTYGDNDAEFGNWAGNLTLGYTFDVAWSPRVYVGGEYYGGEDERDLSLFEWLNPFERSDASVSFNRLFTTWESDWFLDGGSLSNYYNLKTGVSAQPFEKLEVGLDVLYMAVLDGFERPASVKIGNFLVPIAPALSFWDEGGPSDLGYAAILWGAYQYSEDVSFEAGWEHFFTGSALEQGAFSNAYGLGFLNSVDDDDGDYFYLGTKICF